MHRPCLPLLRQLIVQLSLRPFLSLLRQLNLLLFLRPFLSRPLLHLLLFPNCL